MSREHVMYRQLVEEHQRQLLREAELDRLATQARSQCSTVTTRMRLRVSALLFALGRSVHPHNAGALLVAEYPRSLTWRSASVSVEE